MESLNCKKCCGKLKIDGNCLVCISCGEIYSLGAAEMENDEHNSENVLEDKSKDRRKWMFPLMGWVFFLILISCFIWIFVGTIPSNQVQKILEESNYPGFEVIDTMDLGSNVDGLNGENLLVLLKRNNGAIRYGMCAVNIKEKTVTDLAFGYGPLNIIVDKVFLSGEKMNISNLGYAASFIRTYGFHCFKNQKYAEDYIKLITGENGIIDTETAKQAIIDSIRYILPNIHSSSDFHIVFEEGNANPTHYAVLSSEMRYNWAHIFPENVYRVWKANTDRSTQGTMIALYGQPYVQKEVWAVVDKNLKAVGTFDSLDFVKKKFGGKSASLKNNETEVKYETSWNAEKKSENTLISSNSTEVQKTSFDSNNEYIFPSDRIQLTKEHLDELSQDEVALLRNEIYARHGYIFNREKYKTYFGEKTWYKPNANFDENMLNSIERKNKDFIVKYEIDKGWR